MKSIMITAPSSGSGKTLITMGLIRALKKRGYSVSAFKTGPDYIDTAFLAAASGDNPYEALDNYRKAGNLDIHLQGEEGILQSLSLAEGELSVIEGAMGYFDGVYNTYINSSYDIARKINVNSVLVYTPKGEMFSAVPKIKGMAEFEDSTLKAIILNKVTQQYYELLKEQIEKHTKLKVLGYIPKIEEFEIKSRHLGLIQSREINELESIIEKAAEYINQNIDIDLLFELMSNIHKYKELNYKRRDITVAIALDKAFSFYYRENLQLLHKTCNVVYFSPLKDKVLPKCDLLYLGGGYPEVYKDELSRNTFMRESIKNYIEGDGCVYAECGGFMYLAKYIEDKEMIGIFQAKSSMTPRLQRFGYIDITLDSDCILGSKGDKLTAHEFHKSITEINEEGIYKIQKTMGQKRWSCGYLYKNVLAGYPHINFLGNLKNFEHLINYVERRMK